MISFDGLNGKLDGPHVYLYIYESENMVKISLTFYSMNQVIGLECTMCDTGGRLELHYWKQEYTGVQTGLCRLSEEKIQEIIHAKYEYVQKILSEIPVEWKK